MSTAAAALGEKKKRCHYEVLGLARDCSPEEIRSAYRRLALQLHPDKVAAQFPGGVISPAATVAFQDLLHAYETLSDPSARAYYDSHRSQILFSDPSTTTSSSKKHSFFDLDLFSFFSPSAYSGFSDVGRGFYKVYGDVFAKLYEKEVWYLKEMGLALDSVRPPPLIGNAESPYDQVTAFYGYWLGFCTVLDFGWVDLYDAAAGDNRRARRLMEEENKKLRKKAKKEYNESVRGLAAFAKKKDKRVVEYAAKKRAEEEKRRLEEKDRRREEERRKMERARMYEDQEWAIAEVVVEEEGENGGDIDGFFHEDAGSHSTSNKKNRKHKASNNGSCGSELYCVVCSKKFKSEKQWKNHEQSKKHRDKVSELRESMLDDDDNNDEHGNEEATLRGDCREGPCASFDDVHDNAKSDLAVDELCEEFEYGLGSQMENNEALASEDTDEKMSHDEVADVIEAMLSGHKSRQAVNLDQSNTSCSKTSPADSEGESFMEYVDQKKRHKSRTKRRGHKGKADEDDKEDFKREKQENKIQPQDDKAQNMEDSASHPLQEAGTKQREDDSSGKNQKPKNHQIDGKGAGKKDKDLFSKNSSKGKKQKGTSKASRNKCGTCGESFDSRNKLFAHLGDLDHAMLKSR